MVVSFFTRIPVKGNLESTVKTIPLVIPLAFGLSIVPFLIARYSPSGLNAVLSILSIYLIWGPLHAEALMDFFDGLGGGYKAMKDPNIGAFGILAMFFILFLEIFSVVPEYSFFAISEMGAKLTMLTLMLGKPLGEGLGKFFMERFDYKKYSFAWIFAILLGYTFFGFKILYIIFSIPVALSIYVISVKRFGGVNGDVMGAGNEIGRVVIMLCMRLSMGL